MGKIVGDFCLQVQLNSPTSVLKMKMPVVPTEAIDHVECGKIIRSRRLKIGMSLRNLAIKMGVTAPFVSDLERGRRNWSEKHFNKAMQILKNEKYEIHT